MIKKNRIKIREGQLNNDDKFHHPEQKIEQIEKVLEGEKNLSIIEFFAGQGNLTPIYEKFGKVEICDKLIGTGDSYLLFHKLIYDRERYDVIDLDPYGFPNRFFPDIFLLIENGYMFITMPKPYVNVLCGITAQHLICYYGEQNPSLKTIITKIRNYALCHWRDIEILDELDLGRLWRIALKIMRVKANEYTGIRNRRDEDFLKSLEARKRKPLF